MKKDYLSLSEVLPAFFWLVVLLVIAHGWKSYRAKDPGYRYFLPSIYYKLFGGIAFSLFYILYYGGGDTIAYYDGAISLNNLFVESPSAYFNELFANPTDLNYHYPFNSRTGFPPGWIYREPEGYFVCKITSFFSFFSIESFLATTLIFSFIAGAISWRLFRLVRTLDLCNEKYVVYGILFIPSVTFWCSGISKDTVMVVALFGLTFHFFKIILPNQKSNLWNFLMLIIFAYLIYKVRTFVLIAVAIPALFVLSGRLMKKIGIGSAGIILIRVILIVGIFVTVGLSMIGLSESEFLKSNSFIQEASVIQRDFQQNETYGQKKYDLGMTEFTPTGLLLVMPLAITYGIYGPLIWDSISPTLILNGLESLVFLFLTYKFLRRSFRKKLVKIVNNEFLLYSFILILILAFMTGLTSVLWGVLVRLRAPLLPFFVILMGVQATKKSEEKLLDQKPENH